MSLPHLPSNTKTVDEVAGMDIRAGASSAPAPTAESTTCGLPPRSWRAARWPKGVRCIVIPATQDIYMQAHERGPDRDLHRAPAAVVSTPTCGPCLGGHMGVLSDAGERAISTTNRNFVGRMGHVESLRSCSGHPLRWQPPPPWRASSARPGRALMKGGLFHESTGMFISMVTMWIPT